MRTAVLLAALILARALDPHGSLPASEANGVLGALLLFLIADVIDLVRKR